MSFSRYFSQKYLKKFIPVLLLLFLFTPLPTQAGFFGDLLRLVPIVGGPLSDVGGGVIDGVASEVLGSATSLGISIVKSSFQYTLTTILGIIVSAANWIILHLAKLLGPLLAAHGFISNEVVIAGWTFVQGLANVGFIIGLIFIALAISLRFESYNLYKILPRLIIVALLINFSLILTGILIDISQLGVAVIARAMSAVNVNSIGNAVLLASGMLQLDGLLAGQRLLGGDGWAPVLSLFLMALVSLVFLSGLLVLIIGLVVRYFMIALLLIVSPFAFFFAIFPSTEDLARRWWKEFLRWVFYAPIALFIVLLITKASSLLLVQPAGGIVNSLFKIIIVTVLLYMAAITGKKLGGQVGASALSFATARGKQLARTGRNFAYGTVSTATAPARWAGRAAVNKIKPEIKRELGYRAQQLKNVTGISQVNDYFTERGRLIDRARQGAETTRQQTSAGTLAAQQQYDPAGYARSQVSIGRANAVRAAGNGAAWNDPALTAPNLRDRNVQGAISVPQMRTIITQAQTAPGTNNDQLEVIVTSPTMVGRMDDTMVNNLLNELRRRVTAGGATPAEIQQANRMVGELNRTIRTVQDQQNRS